MELRISYIVMNSVKGSRCQRSAYRCFLQDHLLVVFVDQGLQNEPRSKKDRRYISDKIGRSLISIFLHNFCSCSGVSCGGGGKLDSPPKSTSPDEKRGSSPERSTREGAEFFFSDITDAGRKQRRDISAFENRKKYPNIRPYL